MGSVFAVVGDLWSFGLSEDEGEAAVGADVSMRVRTRLQTSPSPGLEFYEGYIDVTVDAEADREEIFLAAVRELRRTAFPDRGARCWKMLSFEAI